MCPETTATERSLPLSIIVVVFNMAREAPRTLFTLSSLYQRGVASESYEVIVVENGPQACLSEGVVESFGANFRWLHNTSENRTLARAVNLGVAAARGKNLGIMVDGARMASPGVIHLALDAFARFANPVLGTPGFHLGDDVQSRSVLRGYNQQEEDRLLARVPWEDNGYRLYEISTPGESSRFAWLGPLLESNFLFLRRDYFDQLNGFDEAFDFPGGGLVNLDFWSRAIHGECDATLSLMGEATFHQFHGGVMTNRPAHLADFEIRKYLAQYREIRGADYQPPSQAPLLYGYNRPEAAQVLLNASAALRAENEQLIPG